MSSNTKNVFNCPVEATIHLIGGKYKAVILWQLKDQVLRYSELHKLVPKATPKMLTQQLRELENDNLIGRTVYPVVPPKTEYYLTEGDIMKLGNVVFKIKMIQINNFRDKYLSNIFCIYVFLI